MSLLKLWLLGDEANPRAYVAGIGAMTHQSFYLHGVVLPRAPQVTLDLPARASGDLLVCHTSSPGGPISDMNGNWTTSIETGNKHKIWTRTATADSNDNFTFKETDGDQHDAERERLGQIINIKSVSGAPTFLEAIGTEVNGTTYDYEITDRDLPVSETKSILTIITYQGQKETGGGLSGDTPYGVISEPDDTTLIGKGAFGYLQPNPKYFLVGWSYKYMTVVSTTVKEGLTYKPSALTALGAESEWLAFYAEH